jgi:anti-sigma factor ChrR (cupin superfamily)
MRTACLNAAFDQRVVVPATCAASWLDSPEPGVNRHRLERIGDEVAQATSLVRYDAGARFARHVHGGGEELLVLYGSFCDERGESPAGTWLRSPRGSRHTPFTGAERALIYVKVGHLGACFLSLP